MMLLMRFETALGSRTAILEAGDPDTANAIANAHRHAGGYAEVIPEGVRISLKDHMIKHKQGLKLAAARAAKKPVLPANVTKLADRVKK